MKSYMKSYGVHRPTDPLVHDGEFFVSFDQLIDKRLKEAERAIAFVSRNTTGLEIESGRVTTAIRELREAYKAKRGEPE